MQFLLGVFSLVLAGALLYWRAANRVVEIEGRGALPAAIAAALIVIFGVLVLWMDFTATWRALVRGCRPASLAEVDD
jgi:uncharacterized membrane protein